MSKFWSQPLLQYFVYAGSEGSGVPSLLDNALSTKIPCAGSFFKNMHVAGLESD